MTTRRPLGVLLSLALALAGSDSFAADPARVKLAVERGAAHLRRLHAPQENYTGGDHGIGTAGLAGLAMLEAGVKPDDAAITNITNLTRAGALADTRTYNVSLAILFLDRLGDPRDVPLIQLLGTRLYGGLCADGSYTYSCADLVPLDPAANNLLVGTPDGLKQDPKAPKPPDNGFAPADKNKPFAPAAKPGKLHPSVAAHNAAVRQVVQSGGRRGAGGDNSNTQFGLIGLWVASRHGVPCDDAFVLLEARFLLTQSSTDAGWGYNGPGGTSTTAMTCAGLLGLAIGTSLGKVKPPDADPAKPGAADDPFTRAEKPKGAGAPKPNVANPLLPNVTAQQRKNAIDGALKSIGGVIKAAKSGQMPLSQFVGFGDEYYTLWSIERVGMAYGLDTIGDIDWHQWGSDYLLPLQGQDGGWPSAGHSGGDVSTSFAILFLVKSNFVKDLTRTLTGKVKDPGKAELRAGRDFKPPLIAPQTPMEKPPEPGVRPPEEAPTPANVTALADALVIGVDFAAKLREARDTKGAEYTAALVKALPRLNEGRQKEAREALAERLTRMTAKTLKVMLKETESELRRAAALACAMKDDKSHVPDLIDRVTDPADGVVQAARAGLKSLTAKDFGPPVGADDEAKRKAAAEWNKWYLAGGK